MDFDMEKAIKDCEKSKRDDEEIVYAVGSGRLIPFIGELKGKSETLELIKSLDGFLGVFPANMWNNLILFDTLNNAKSGANVMRFNKIKVGNICPLLVLKKDIGR